MPSTTRRNPRRASRAQVRIWAWIVGTFGFLAPWALFGVSPRPAANASTASQEPSIPRAKRPVVVIVTKRIVIGASSSSTVSRGPIHYVYAPAPSTPTTVSCGTHPC
jgi:hypothetical protein